MNNFYQDSGELLWGDKRLDKKLHEHPLIPVEFNDIVHVLEFGAQKYSPNQWLEPKGIKSSFEDMHGSMQRHLHHSLLAELTGEREDNESGYDALLHLAVRALMAYTKIKRGIYD